MTAHKTLGHTCVALALTLAMGTATAHHSRANFDLHKVVNFEGTVSRFEWTNPHTGIDVMVKMPNGEMVMHSLEGNSIATMVRRGFKSDSIKPGDHVRIVANPERAEGSHFYYLNAVYVDGKKVGGGFGSGGNETQIASAEESDAIPFTGVWRQAFRPRPQPAGADGGNAVLLGRPLPSNLPVTAKGVASYAKFHYADDPSNNCVPESLPAAIHTAPYLFEIRHQKDGNFIFLNENYAAPRVIHMDQTAPPAGTQPDYDGYSVGRIDNGVLIITTTLFSPEPWGNDTGLDSSAEKELVERYHVGDGGKQLEVTYAQTDPVYLLKTVSQTLRWNQVDRDLANIWDGSKCTKQAGNRHLTEGHNPFK